MTGSTLRTAPSPQLCRNSWKLVPKENVLCQHHVEEGPLFGSHGAAARHKPNADAVSHSWRCFLGTAVRIIARTVKGSEEIAPCLEKIGRGATCDTSSLAAPPASSHGAPTRRCPETRSPAPVRDDDLTGRRRSVRGDNQERGLVRSRGAAGCERGVATASSPEVRLVSNHQLLGRAFLNGW